MLATQVAYYKADGVTRLLDKGVTPCDAGDLATARAARDAGLTHLQRAKLAAEDDVWDAWPGPVPEELLRAADAARKAAAAEAKLAAGTASNAEIRAAYQREQAAAPPPVVPPVPASPVAEEADFEMSLDDMRATARATAKRKAKAKKRKGGAKRARPERIVKWKLSGCTVAVTPMRI
jgi:hypothetical protein